MLQLFFNYFNYLLHRPARLNLIAPDQFVTTVSGQYDIWRIVVSQYHVPALEAVNLDTSLC